jgi:hypothetical protein
LSHFLVLLRELRLHLGLAQRRQVVPVVGWLLLERDFVGAITPLKFSEGNDLVEKEHGVEISVSFPDEAWAHLAKSL